MYYILHNAQYLLVFLNTIVVFKDFNNVSFQYKQISESAVRVKKNTLKFDYLGSKQQQLEDRSDLMVSVFATMSKSACNY